jgi:hypothetical protein
VLRLDESVGGRTHLRPPSTGAQLEISIEYLNI